jgi:hypothetical protein
MHLGHIMYRLTCYWMVCFILYSMLHPNKHRASCILMMPCAPLASPCPLTLHLVMNQKLSHANNVDESEGWCRTTGAPRHKQRGKKMGTKRLSALSHAISNGRRKRGVRIRGCLESRWTNWHDQALITPRYLMSLNLTFNVALSCINWTGMNQFNITPGWSVWQKGT